MYDKNAKSDSFQIQQLFKMLFNVEIGEDISVKKVLLDKNIYITI